MRPIAFLILVLLVASCNGPDSDNGPAGGEELPATTFTIDPTRDTVLKTPGGATLKITAGSLAVEDANTVKLLVKEAYTPQAMIDGKLQNRTNNSSGMIYVNLAPGQNVSIHQPLVISIPVAYPQKDMMVYTGKVDETTTVNWGDPRPLQENPGVRQVDAGKSIFQASCASCHGLRRAATGPPLAWITQRRDKQWLYAFTKSNAKMLWRGDALTCYLFNRYNKTAMPTFPSLSNADLESLYRYIDYASQGIDSNSVFDEKRSLDSCVKNDPNCSSIAQRAKTVTGQETADTTTAGTQTTATAPPTRASNYYIFTIDKHGWYNIARRPGTETAAAEVIIEAVDSSRRVEPLQACPCWCNESAYRKADSIARARPAMH